MNADAGLMWTHFTSKIPQPPDAAAVADAAAAASPTDLRGGQNSTCEAFITHDYEKKTAAKAVIETAWRTAVG